MKSSKYQRYFLKNGIEVAVYPIKEIRSVALRFGLNAGSSIEEEDSVGTLHFLEHVFFQGCKKYPSEFKTYLRSEELGLNDNASVGSVDTRFWYFSPDTNFQETIKLALDILSAPLLPAEAIRNSKKVILTEQADHWDVPENVYFHKATQKRIGKNHIYTRHGFGNRSVVAKMTRGKVLEAYSKYYSPQNLKIAISGNVDFSKTKKLLEVTFGKWRANAQKLSFPTPSNNLPKLPQTYIYNEKRKQVNYSLHFPITGYIEDKPLRNSMIFHRFSYMLGKGGNSLLYRRLRQQLGLVYWTASYVNRLPYLGSFEIAGQTDVKNIKRAILETFEIIDKARTKGFSKDRFRRASSYIDAQNLMSFSHPNEISDRLLDNLLDNQKIRLPKDYIEAAKKLSVEDISQKAKQTIDLNKIFISMMGDTKSIHDSGVMEIIQKATS